MPLEDIEVTIFIHGISPAPEPKTQESLYNRFDSLLRNEFDKISKTLPSNSIKLHWGFDNPNTPEVGDEILSSVERRLYDQVTLAEDRTRSFTINPLRLVYQQIRKNFILGFTDLFYYISYDGRSAVQKNVFESLNAQLPPLGDNQRYSFTIVSHSAGTIIMHDFLHLLFSDDPSIYASDWKEKPRGGVPDPVLPSIRRLRKLAKADEPQIRIKAFITLGSPLASMVVRSQRVMEILHNDNDRDMGKLKLADLGIRTHSDQDISAGKWMNFWDIDDVISYPLEFLYDNPNSLITDYHVNVGGMFPDTHSAYWESAEIAQRIAAEYPRS